MAAEKILEIWAKRNPEWETKYEDTIIKVFCDYGKGTTSYQHAQKSLVLVMKYLSLHFSLDCILIKRKNLLLISLNARVLDGQLRTGVISNHVQGVNSILELESICLWH